LSKTKILVVDDNINLLEVLKLNFTKEGYDTILARNGIEAVDVAKREKPDLVILDIMLPDMDGFEVCRIIRHDATIPIIMLSAKTDEVDKIVCLELGADDYLTKPFSLRELIARVRAFIRRTSLNRVIYKPESNSEGIIKIGRLELDRQRHRFQKDGIEIALSPKEFELLSLLIENQQHVYNREELLEKIWGYDFEGNARTVDVHMVSLRKKIEDNPADPQYLLSVRGVGYKFENKEFENA
jgi:two-component system, OmpR family, alkaline phosphatase synthesis response regulator PhoP